MNYIAFFFFFIKMVLNYGLPVTAIAQVNPWSHEFQL